MFRSLLSESETRLFPDNDLLRRLRLVTQDAEKCASVAQQLLNGKRQTRYEEISPVVLLKGFSPPSNRMLLLPGTAVGTVNRAAS